MNIFLSWSGPTSRRLAGMLRSVLPKIHPGLNPFLSDADLRLGRQWRGSLLEALNRSDACIICLTNEVLGSSWVHFEVGAIAGRAANGQVDRPILTFLIDTEAGSLSGPLEQWQAATFDLDAFRRMAFDLNERMIDGERMDVDQLECRVRRCWPEVKSPQLEPASELMRLSNAKSAPYMLGSVASLMSPNSLRPIPEGDLRRALWELHSQIASLPRERNYLPKIIDEIQDSSVCAVCGQKSEASAAQFNGANAAAAAAGSDIERIFFPPSTAEEAPGIRRAIETHLRSGMRVRAFQSTRLARSVRCQEHLPLGFGMTLLGTPRQIRAIDGRLTGVLVHWGGVGEAAEHYGVILREPEWTAQFADLYRRIAAQTSVASEPDLNSFLKHHECYQPC